MRNRAVSDAQMLSFQKNYYICSEGFFVLVCQITEYGQMLNNLLEKLKDRPILSIIICVLLSEIIQLIVVLLSDSDPAFHYGIAVIALLVLFATPVLLSAKKKSGEGKDESEEKEVKTDDDDQPDRA